MAQKTSERLQKAERIAHGGKRFTSFASTVTFWDESISVDNRDSRLTAGLMIRFIRSLCAMLFALYVSSTKG
jgi:hypothetical protein